MVVSVSKGIENGTQLTMTGVLKETLGLTDERLAVLSGPSFAVEVARRMPTVVTVAARKAEAGPDGAAHLRDALTSGCTPAGTRSGSSWAGRSRT